MAVVIVVFVACLVIMAWLAHRLESQRSLGSVDQTPEPLELEVIR